MDYGGSLGGVDFKVVSVNSSRWPLLVVVYSGAWQAWVSMSLDRGAIPAYIRLAWLDRN
jgi:hypothetical protein